MHDVKVRRTEYYYNAYIGTPEALIAAGLVTAEMIPTGGQRRKTFAPDGTQCKQADPRRRYVAPGYKVVHRLDSGHIRVDITVDADEQARRRSERKWQWAERHRQWDEERRQREWAALLERGAPPRSLARSALRLIWSEGRRV